MTYVRVVRDGQVTEVILSQREVIDAINPEMHRELQAAFGDFAVDPAQYIAM